MTARTRTGLLGLLLATLLGLTGLGALPAMAHDVLATSDPAEGDVLGALPGEVTLVFSGDVKALGTKILVKGPSGEVQDGTPTVDRMVVKQRLKGGQPAGAYTVEWRVTSSDGHPIAGTIHFTVKGGAAGTRATGAPSTSATTSGAATTPSAPPTTPPTTDEPTTDRWGLWAVLGGLALLVAAGVVYATSRRRG